MGWGVKQDVGNSYWSPFIIHRPGPDGHGQQFKELKVTDPWLKSSFSHLKVQTVCCALTSEPFTLPLCTQPSFSMHYREFSLKEISIV